MTRRECVTLNLDPEQWAELGAISAACRVPKAQLVRDAIHLYLTARHAVRVSMVDHDAPSASLARAAGADEPLPPDGPANQAAPRRPSARRSAVRAAELLDELEGVITSTHRLLDAAESEVGE